MTTILGITVAAVVLAATLVTLNRQRNLENRMSKFSDDITAAFDDLKTDVLAKFTALESNIKPSMTQAEVDAFKTDIAVFKAQVDATPTDGSTPA